MNTPLVHVLVINWNGIQHLCECFDSLLMSTYPNVRFVLVDNASTDGSVEFVQKRYGEDERVRILSCPRNLGWAGGNNVGIEKAIEAGAPYIFLLNNDTVTAPDAIERLVEAAEKNPTAGALAPKILLYDNDALLNSIGLDCSLIASSWDVGIGRLDGPQWHIERKVIGASGGAAFFRTAALVKSGLLPPDFQIYFDDLDLCLRIWDAGFEIWTCPGAVVRHKYGATMGHGKNARRKEYLASRNRLRVILRNFPRREVPRVVGGFLKGEIRALGRAILERDLLRAFNYMRSWISALAYLPEAIEARHRRKTTPGVGFWPLIRTDCQFFAGTEFPRDGWYTPRAVSGTVVRPISARARIRTAGGKLRLIQMNCYPRLGPSAIQVLLDGNPIVRLETNDRREATIDVTPGTLEFASERVFRAEETGERIDIGGWLGIVE